MRASSFSSRLIRLVSLPNRGRPVPATAGRRAHRCWPRVLMLLPLALGGFGVGSAVAYGLRGGVIANAGATAGGSQYTILGTAGQGVAGTTGVSSILACSGFWCFGGVRVVSAGPPGIDPRLPDRVVFGRALPNPTRGQARFELALPKDSDVRLTIFSLGGRVVGTPVAGRMPAGWHHVQWDPTSESQLRSGVYFARLEVNGAPAGDRQFVVLH
jgi:hypothetical protein